MFAAGSTSEPYELKPFLNGLIPALDLTGKTPVSPKILLNQSTAIIVVLGQSNITTTVLGGAYTPVNSMVHNLNVYTGGMYRAADPLLGDQTSAGNYGSTLTRLGDKLITQRVFQRSILKPLGVGASTISDWDVGGHYHHRIDVCARRLQSLGLTATHIIWHQGESDAVDGTSQAAYYAALLRIIAAFRAAGMGAPFFVCKATWFAGSLPAGSAAVRAAQAQIVDNDTVFAGPDTDTLDNTYRFDTTHFSPTGSEAFADLLATVIRDHKYAH